MTHLTALRTFRADLSRPDHHGIAILQAVHAQSLHPSGLDHHWVIMYSVHLTMNVAPRRQSSQDRGTSPDVEHDLSQLLVSEFHHISLVQSACTRGCNPGDEYITRTGELTKPADLTVLRLLFINQACAQLEGLGLEFTKLHMDDVLENGLLEGLREVEHIVAKPLHQAMLPFMHPTGQQALVPLEELGQVKGTMVFGHPMLISIICLQELVQVLLDRLMQL